MNITNILLLGILIILIAIAHRLEKLHSYIIQRDYNRDHPDLDMDTDLENLEN